MYVFAWASGKRKGGERETEANPVSPKDHGFFCFIKLVFFLKRFLQVCLTSSISSLNHMRRRVLEKTFNFVNRSLEVTLGKK